VGWHSGHLKKKWASGIFKLLLKIVIISLVSIGNFVIFLLKKLAKHIQVPCCHLAAETGS
jgi:hypothetical protein